MTKKQIILMAVCALAVITIVTIAIKGSKPKINSSEPEFAQYISAYTNGAINKNSTIKVIINSTLAEKIGKNVKADDLIKIYPSISGECKFTDERTIEFTPKTNLRNDKEYIAEFNLKKLIDTGNDKLDKFVFGFSVITQDMRILIENQTTTDRKTLKYQRVSGVVKTSDYEILQNIKHSVSATYNGKNIPINFRETEDASQNFNFTIDSIERFDEAKRLVIKYDGANLDSKSQGERIVEIPSIKEFKVNKIDVINDEKQCLKIVFSDPLKENQDLEGLISIKEGMDNRSEKANSDYKFQIEDNCVNIYPATRKRGEIQITLAEGIQNILGTKTDGDQIFNVNFEVLKPQIRTVKTGLILPESNDGLVYPFEAVNLTAVDVTIIKVLDKNILSYIRDYSEYYNEGNIAKTGVPVFRKTIHIAKDDDEGVKEWKRYYLELSKLVKTEPGTIYDLKIAFRKSHAIFDCDTCGGGYDASNEQDVDMTDFEKLSGYNYYGLDGYSYGYYDDYDYDYDYGGTWERRQNPCYQEYYSSDKFIEQCILASNLGVIAKKGPNNNLTVYATDLKSAKSVSGATVEIYGYQQQLLASKTTDGDGKADFNDVKKAYVAVVKNGNEANYLKLEDGNSLSLSKFDISGTDVTDGLRGYLYGERGVWRPGDSIHLSFILKEENEQPLPEGFPITLEVRNSRSQQIVKETVKKNNTNFYVFNFKTDDEAPTGTYNAVVTCGNATFRTNLRVENVKPNRLKIFADFNKEFLTTKNNSLKIKSTWLHGATAANLKVSVSRKLSPRSLEFENFKDYKFSNARTTDYDGYEQQIFSGNLDQNGEVTVRELFNKKSWETFPNKLRARYEIKVFEKSGAFSIDAASIDLYPYDYYFGIRMPQTDRWCLEVDKDYKVDLVAVDTYGKLDTKNHRIAVKLYKLKWQYWYDSNNYISNYDTEILQGDTLNISGRASYNFKVKYPDWGRYMIEATDLETGNTSSEIFYMDWPESFGRSPMMSQGTTVIELTSDKTTYNVGETVKINIPAPEDSRALISIESASKVLRSQWVDAKAGNTEFQFQTDEKMVPGAYVFVTLLQPHGQTVNDLPIRMYGVLPINVEDEKTKLQPEISMPDKIEAESEVHITVSEKSNKSMTYTIAVVDDGLLDLTHFQTPDAWKTFYSRPSLNVRTFDMFDNVIGAFGGKIERIFSIGGDDESSSEQGKKKANNFESVVAFLGPFTYDGKKRTHTIKMPKYIGSVRTMVVAGNGKAFGSAEKTSIVSKPLMLYATTPRLLSTSEKFVLPVTVFTGEDNIKNVNITVKASNGFTLEGESSKQLTFSGKGEQNPEFQLKTADTPGIGTVEITAVSGSHKSTIKLDVEIRQPNVKTTHSWQRLVKKGETVDIEFDAIGRANTNTGQINVCGVLPMNLDYHLTEINTYPYESLESIVSRGFAMLYADKLSDMTAAKKDSIESIIRKSIEKIYSYQASSGGLSYWRNYNYTDVWITNYTGHFMAEAKKAGYSVKKDFFDKWKKYQKAKAEGWTADNRESYSSQAYRLYTLTLNNEALTGQMNRLKQQKNLTDDAKIYLAAAYALSGKAETGKSLINTIPVENRYYDKTSMLLTLCELGEREKAFTIARNLSLELTSENYWALLHYESMSIFALGKYFEKYKQAKEINCNYKFNSQAAKDVKTEKLFYSGDLKFTETGKQVLTFTNNSSGDLYVELTNSGIPEVGQEKAENSIITCSVKYVDASGKEISPKNIKQGTEFTSIVTIKNPSDEYINDLVITEMYASGWEIDNNIVSDSGSDDDEDDDYYYRRKYSINFTDIRDDKKFTYFTLNPKGSITFKTQLVAAYKGSYYLPGIVCENLKDNKIFAKTKGSTAEVE